MPSAKETYGVYLCIHDDSSLAYFFSLSKLIFTMDQHMSFHGAPLVEPFTTDYTSKRFLASVDSHVSLERKLSGECPETQRALNGSVRLER